MDFFLYIFYLENKEFWGSFLLIVSDDCYFESRKIIYLNLVKKIIKNNLLKGCKNCENDIKYVYIIY